MPKILLVQQIMRHMLDKDITNYIRFRCAQEDPPEWIDSPPVEQRAQAIKELKQALFQVPESVLVDIIARLDNGETLPDYNNLMISIASTEETPEPVESAITSWGQSNSSTSVEAHAAVNIIGSDSSAFHAVEHNS